jgi:hypothetical protein
MYTFAQTELDMIPLNKIKQYQRSIESSVTH